ncbi:Conjugative transposon protein TcpC [Streptomyces noursei ATCC 11455]|nr:Conjugative transposon protein TcpC [Streptomyces noursei ATCC 11455]ANZ21955.1 Conjugative transposon protein TcpC [Streptomyces noursei ATCC 11455]
MPPLPASGNHRRASASSPSDSAGQSLRHRRVSLVRAAALVALACGPLALATSWFPSVPAVGPAHGAVQQATGKSGGAEGPGGFAELFVRMWLAGDPGDGQASDAQKTARSLAPEVALPEFHGRPPAVTVVRTVRCEAVRPGAWSVTVGVVLQSPGTGPAVRYFRFPVLWRNGAGAGGGQSFVVTAAPSAVPGPVAGRAGSSPYTVEVSPGSALASTVGQFLAAYLGGSGGAERYLAARVRLPALGVSYGGVRTERVSSTQSAGEVGRDGQQVRVLARVVARDAQGTQWPLSYALRLSAREGRWEVLAVESGLEGEGVSGRGGGA